MHPLTITRCSADYITNQYQLHHRPLHKIIMAVPEMRKAYLDTAYGQLHYRYVLPSGPPKDTLIFLHMSATSSASMTKLMDHYSPQGYACYAPDMPGFGGSFDPSDAAVAEISTQGTRWYVNLYLSAFAALGLTRYHIVGHHTGASLATEMAALRPEAVKSLCLGGTSVMSAEERATMKARFFAPFNQPVPDGSHLLRTWEYVAELGVGEDLESHQQNTIDHIRAWRGRNQIYGAIWDQDVGSYMKEVSCPVVAMCAKDDVLWPYFDNIARVRPDVPMIEIKGGNFQPERDPEGIVKEWTPLFEKSM
jgi:pimeloyl-ACP methyl ester carboxylesterase